jgi:hypothetical protein
MRIALLPYTLDTIFIKSLNQYGDLRYLVRKDSPEELWVKNFLPKNKIMKYTCKNNSDQQTFEDLCKDSDIVNVIRSNDIDAVAVNKSTKYVDDLFKVNKMKLITVNYEYRKRFEDKCWFDNYLSKNNFPKPNGGVYNHSVDHLHIPVNAERFVLQDPISTGGEGTYFISSLEHLRSLFAQSILDESKDYLVREFVEGNAYGITISVSSSKIILSAIRQQCYYKNSGLENDIFSGLQWIKFSELEFSLRKDLDDDFGRFGRKIHSEGFRGFANVDFMIDGRGKIYFLECNARMSAAGTHLALFPELCDHEDIFQYFLSDTFSNNAISLESDLQVGHFPKSEFDGAFLTLAIAPSGKSPVVIKNIFENGLYFIEDGEIIFWDHDIRKFPLERKSFIVYSGTEIGERYEKFSSVAEVESNFRLFDELGNINEDGLLITKYFNFV